MTQVYIATMYALETHM